MENTNLNWRKATYSSNGGGNCVEVAGRGNRVLVRDTKDRTSLMLRFTPGAWRRFADQVKRSLAFDPLPGAGPFESFLRTSLRDHGELLANGKRMCTRVASVLKSDMQMRRALAIFQPVE
jgi:hypothetical protein